MQNFGGPADSKFLSDVRVFDKPGTSNAQTKAAAKKNKLFSGFSRLDRFVVPVFFDFNACVFGAFSAFLCRDRSRSEPTPATMPSPSLSALEVVQIRFFLFGADVRR